MREYKEFLNVVKGNIIEYLPEEYRGGEFKAEIVSVPKANDTILDGLTIHEGETGSSPIIYLERFYDALCNGATEEEVMRDIATMYIGAKDRAALFDMSEVGSWEKMKSKIGYLLLNKEMNATRLDGKVCSPVTNLTKAYIFIVAMEDDGIAHSLISMDILKEWGVSIDELNAVASENMERLFPATLMPMTQTVLSFKTGIPVPNLLHENAEISKEIMYILTTENSKFASALTYPGLLQKIRMLLCDDFYIIPSSTEEVLIIPKETAPSTEELRTMLLSVNSTMEKQLILSDVIYEYSLDNGELQIANTGEN